MNPEDGMAFNSTRYIRNEQQSLSGGAEKMLSTPHGTLGTKKLVWATIRQSTPINFQLHTVHQELVRLVNGKLKPVAFNSTRYIRNANYYVVELQRSFRLSTPHGTLGTGTEYISNCNSAVFQLHTVHQEPQTTTLTKIRHINNFVKGVPLSNEVNFPKSEIMQS